MDETSYVFDPDGDVYLVLRNPKVPLAVWFEEKREPPEPSTPGPNAEWKPFETSLESIDPAEPMIIISEAYMYAEEPRAEPGPEPVLEPDPFEPAPEPVEPASDDDAPETTDREEEPSEIPKEVEDPFPAPGAGTPPLQREIRMRVSSRHLILASSFFRSALNNYREASDLVVNAEDWDVNALAIVMNIIHGHAASVPRSVELETLARVAVIVDYYQFHEVAGLFAEKWIENLRGDIPKEYGRDLVLWTFVCWVFSQDELFRAATKIAVTESRGPIAADDLPLPKEVTDEIDKVRRRSIDSVFTILNDIKVYLRDRRTECSFACSSILLGALYKEMYQSNILSPPPTDPFLGYSLQETAQAARNIRTARWTSQVTGYGRLDPHRCRISHFVGPNIDRLESKLEGLKLDDFVSSKKRTVSRPGFKVDASSSARGEMVVRFRSK